MTAQAVLSGIVAEPTPWPEGATYHSHLGLFGFQADGVAQAYWQVVESDDPVVDVLWQTGTGKACPTDEPVLTPAGWRPIGSLHPGDSVYSSDGTPATVLSVHPQGVRDIFRVGFSDGTWARCDEEHLWTVTRKSHVRTGSGRAFIDASETLTLREISARGIAGGGGRRRWRIPMTAPVQRPEANLPIDPYTLGVILGDGYVGPNGRVWLTTDKEILDTVDTVGARQPHKSIGIETLANTGRWASALIDLGLAGQRSWEKHVPPEYLLGSESQRRALLAGLIDTDGSPNHTGGAEFSSASQDLAESVVELTQSLGGTATITSRFTKYSYLGESKQGRLSWRVMVKMPVQPFRLSRKADRWVPPTGRPVARYIDSVEPDGNADAVCIRVDRADGLFLTRSHIVTHNTHLVMATNALMSEDKVVDQVIIVAESNKVIDWVKDYAKYTTLDARLYAGSPAKRAEMLVDPPPIMVMTYETGRNDICSFKPKSKAVSGPKMLTESLRGKRVLIIFDEFTKLRSRGALLYVAWNYLVNRVLRKEKTGRVMVMGLTATKIENSPEDHFNANLLLAPWMSTSVAEFERDHIASWDMFGNPSSYKNLTPADCDPNVIPMSTRFARVTLKKRKSDPDVIGHFPSKVEQPPRYVTLGPRHREFYNAVKDLFGESDAEILQSFGLLRQISADPTSLLRSKGSLATQIVDTIGAQALTSMGSAKSDEMLGWASELGGDQGVIFTFYGQSVLPVLAQRLRERKILVSINHGQMSLTERARSQDAFKAGDTQIFLSSDAGARGLNLGCGSALLHYELPLLYSTFVQRSDRIHRIDSVHESVTIDALVAKDTIEERIADLLIKRNGWSDEVIDDDAYEEGWDPGEQHLTAADRKELWGRARRMVA